MTVNNVLLELVLNGHSKELYTQATYAGRIMLQCNGYTGRHMPVDLGRILKIRGINALPKGVYRTSDDIARTVTGGIGIVEHLHKLNLVKPSDARPWFLTYASLNLALLKCKGHKDLYLKGAGKFKYTVKPQSYSSLKEIRLSGYFNTSAWRVKLNDKEIVRLVQLDFPSERIDEISWARDINFINIFKDNLVTILKRLDEIISRDLKHTYYDDQLIEYPEKIKAIAVKNNLIMPKNGKAIKEAALRFKNCAASYIEKVTAGKYYILFDDYNMTGLRANGHLDQWKGKMNASPTRDFI